METRRRFAVILAAGDGKRMKSEKPKVLCEVLFEPMLKWVETACRGADLDDITIVAGERHELLRAVSPDCRFVLQKERRGTGHAVMMAAEALAGGGDALVLNGDSPFITPEVIEASYAQHRNNGCLATVICAAADDPAGYGRIVRAENGGLSAIVEQRDASPEQLAIREINAGFYWFDAKFLAESFADMNTDNAQGEYYITDPVRFAAARGRAGAYVCADSGVALGANDRRGLRKLNELARERVLERLLDEGADIPCSDGVIVGARVRVGPDAVILPGTILRGDTVIGAGAVIGPNSYLTDSTVGAGSKILASYLTDSTVGDNASIGPFSQLRPDSHVGNGVKIGDFVELKNSTIGDETSIAHLTYIGDSDVGKLCNFGCGVVTANYDGKHKFRTSIGDRAFIGCNTNLISPVHVGEGAYTAAGTTVDSDIPAGALSIGRVRQTIKEDWADQNVGFKAGEK